MTIGQFILDRFANQDPRQPNVLYFMTEDGCISPPITRVRTMDGREISLVSGDKDGWLRIATIGEDEASLVGHLFPVPETTERVSINTPPIVSFFTADGAERVVFFETSLEEDVPGAEIIALEDFTEKVVKKWPKGFSIQKSLPPGRPPEDAAIRFGNDPPTNTLN